MAVVGKVAILFVAGADALLLHRLTNSTGSIEASKALTMTPAYADLGAGKCRKDGEDPPMQYKLGQGHMCERLCNMFASCGGYSVSTADNCILWLSTGLSGGGKSWGGAHCMVKSGMSSPVVPSVQSLPPPVVQVPVTAQAPGTTFTAYYEAASGRGIWKWGNALEAYQRHFGGLAGQPLSIAEVGVQSGGSVLMWKAVLGHQISMHGLDINPACEQFKEPGVSITIGDQGDWNMWSGFFSKVAPTGLDILVDDGSHQPPHMVTTFQAAFPHILAGGYIAIEDINGCPHCPNYLKEFFEPTAHFIAQQAQQGLIDSVHLYPMLLVVRKAGFTPGSQRASEGVLSFSNKKTEVNDWSKMWTAISTVEPGSQIVLRNPAWTDFFLADALLNFFTGFIGLHEANTKDTPAGCATTKAAVCTNEIISTHLQTRVSGIHIYKDHAVIEVPAQAPRIAAVRKGTQWIDYR